VLAEDECAEHASAEIFDVRHPAQTLPLENSNQKVSDRQVGRHAECVRHGPCFL
jgi:hypothetical protein